MLISRSRVSQAAKRKKLFGWISSNNGKKCFCHSNFTNRVALLQILISCLQSLRPTYLMPCLFSCNQTQCKSTHSKWALFSVCGPCTFNFQRAQTKILQDWFNSVIVAQVWDDLINVGKKVIVAHLLFSSSCTFGLIQ